MSDDSIDGSPDVKIGRLVERVRAIHERTRELQAQVGGLDKAVGDLGLQITRIEASVKAGIFRAGIWGGVPTTLLAAVFTIGKMSGWW